MKENSGKNIKNLENYNKYSRYDNITHKLVLYGRISTALQEGAVRMIKIAICDDDTALTSNLEKELLVCAREKKLEFEIDVFSDGDTLMETIHQGVCYDLIYLDVRMKNLDGISAARQIREKNRDTLFIYISSYDCYFVELFEVEPFRFIRKPVDMDQFRRYLDQAVERIQSHAVYFSYSSQHNIYRIPLKKISYFESRQRKVTIHTENTTETFYHKLNDIEKELSQSTTPFLRIHQSYLVNFDAIIRYSFNQVELFDGTLLPISSERQKGVRCRYHELMEIR